MTKQYDMSTNGYDLKVKGPSTVEEYDQKAGSSGQCLADAVENIVYRSTSPEWQRKFADELVKLTGIKRGVDEEATAKAKARAKDGEANDVPEKFRLYNLRVRAHVEAGNVPGVSLGDLNVLAQVVADGIEVDPSPRSREGSLPKNVLAKADEILGLDPDSREAKVGKLLAAVGGFSLDRDAEGTPDRTSLGKLIVAFIQASI